MNRRDFLARFAQTAAGAAVLHTLDVDRLLWVAGERTIFLPPPVTASAVFPMGTILFWDGANGRYTPWVDGVSRYGYFVGVLNRPVRSADEITRADVQTHGPVVVRVVS